MGNRVKLKQAAGESEPLENPCYRWVDWCIARILDALDAGGPPPQFRRADPWSWILLSSAIDRDPELRNRAFIDIRERRVRWEPPEDDDSRAA
jgi:hypothetical protein